MHIYINNKFLRKLLGTNPKAWYKKNMLFKDLMSNVDESGNESESSNKNIIMSNEDEDQHDP
jgi:alpha-amylase/alpha-mannosidase (GH57 family)